MATYLDRLHSDLDDASDHDKEMLVGDRDFVEAVLQNRNVPMHRVSSEIIRILSHTSLQRSAKLMEYGVGSWLLPV